MTSPSLRVLVLEDHAFQRSVAVNLLRELGCHQVFEAADGAQALAVLEQVGSVDLVLCDLCRKGLDGLGFLQQVCRHGLVRAVIISSSLPADLCRAGRQIITLLGLEVLGEVRKPLQLQALEPLLSKLQASRYTRPAAPRSVTLASEDQVRRALDEQRVQAWYQPKYNLLTGEVCGVEVLSRWVHPFLGIVSPAAFMPVVERCGWLDELLYGQMNHAMQLHKQALARGFDLNMAFNLHTRQLLDHELIPSIQRILGRHGVSGAALTFELSESGLLEVPSTSLESLLRLRMLGCQLSIDDFGAGYSSLKRVCQLPFNEIKLDAEFVRSLDQEPRCQVAISSTVALGASLGMSVVVEGIETPEQHKAVLALGCIQGQGYLYGRPMKSGELLSWLNRRTMSGADSSLEPGWRVVEYGN
ncbi:transcriptional regulator [Pseudomonas sp. Eqa60]|uniref:EAL domain-containing response regulator n=1 Tax=Pseudomonas sp. Eqa60 TaxID=2799184 RepID=UPI001BB32328|nr:EAL domain-containing response regulator [Pseudomonas sp. Eqa60]BCQ69800.1 transcriptional regulator [Pseudomonas sp. Eqa60]